MREQTKPPALAASFTHYASRFTVLNPIASVLADGKMPS